MHAKTWITIAVVLQFLVAAPARAAEDNPEACDCESIDITREEIDNGCTVRVKEQTCPLFRQTRIWQERLRQQREQRRLEKQMEPPVPRSR